jgi:hypothetical protein
MRRLMAEMRSEKCVFRPMRRRANAIECTYTNLDSIKADSHIACRAHAVPLPCRAAKGLECVFPIGFTQCGRV